MIPADTILRYARAMPATRAAVIVGIPVCAITLIVWIITQRSYRLSFEVGAGHTFQLEPAASVGGAPLREIAAAR